jgi:AcrR family transcriptional regulator
MELIHTKGIDNVTLSDICTASQIAQGTFYHHFKSMDEILLEIIRREGEEIASVAASLENLPALTQLERLLDLLFSYYDQKGKEIVAQLYRLELKPANGKSIIEEYIPIRPLIRSIILNGQNRDEFNKKESPEFYSSLLTSQIIFQSFLWIRSANAESFSKTGRQTLTSILKLLEKQ